MKKREAEGPTPVTHPQAAAAYRAFQEATMRLFNVLLEDRTRDPNAAKEEVDGAPAYAMVDITCEIIKMFCALASNMPLDPKKLKDREFMSHFLNVNIDLAKRHGIPAAIEAWVADGAS
jgi:hypothetical protein